MISGVEIKQLTTHSDDRGFFREIIRASDPFFDGFGQLSQSFKRAGYYTPEFHLHQHQVDYWYVPFGLMRVVLCDLRQEGISYSFDEYLRSRTFEEHLLGEGQPPVVLKIPPGVAHGMKVIEGPAHLMYVTSLQYDPTDEGRVTLDYDWLK